MTSWRRITVSEPQAGMRLDALLAATLGWSRAQIERLLAQRGAVEVDGRPARAKGLRLAAGQVVAFAAADPTLAPEPDAPLTILARGDDWLAVDKPAGQNIHPLQPGETGTLLQAALAREPRLAGVGEGGLRSGVVHRLDVQTSGCLLLACAQQRWQDLRDAFTEHRTVKVYRALAAGVMSGEGRAVVGLKVTQHKPARVRVVPGEPGGPGVWRCDLHWRALEPLGTQATLLEVRLGTGFLHQIRATLAHLGHPLLGDALYGGPPLAPRVMLHAASLSVLDIAVTAPDPADFTECQARLRRH